jgi:hypothetical protein
MAATMEMRWSVDVMDSPGGSDVGHSPAAATAIAA